MKYVISGTNRHGSRSLKIANIVVDLIKAHGEEVELMDLAHVGLEHLGASTAYGEAVPEKMKAQIAKINSSDGIVIVCPEYNGSMPGALKYFMDHWSYPRSFEFRPFALIGLGTRFGGLRPVEHLQGVLGFRNAFIYPERVFITDVFKALNPEGQLIDEKLSTLLKTQVEGFLAFSRALVAAKLDANHRTIKA